jgi:tRNA pseudouridine55 synthase
VTLRVACSKGTYIRVLAADIGQALGCGAHLIALRRTAVGNLLLAGAFSLADLELLDEAEIDASVPSRCLAQFLAPGRFGAN